MKLVLTFYLGLFFSATSVLAQNSTPFQKRYYDQAEYEGLIDSLRMLHAGKVVSRGDKHELAALLALGHYPELRGNRIKIKYKKNVRHPITASYAFTNLFKLRKWHTYVLLIKPGSFVDFISLNQKVSLIGHEMAHFIFYRKRPVVGMIPWGISYLLSSRYRRDFERTADFTAIEYGLGWQYLDMSIYISRTEVINHMEKLEWYHLEGFQLK